MKLFLSKPSPQIIGVDIGRSEIKAVQLKKFKNNSISLVAYGSKKLKNSKLDPITNPACYIDSLNGLLEAANYGSFSGTHFSISLPVRHVYINKTAQPGEFNNAASNNFNLAKEKLFINIHKVPGSESYLGLASSRPEIIPHLDVLGSMRPLFSSEHEVSAAGRAITRPAEIVCLIDIGSEQTTITGYYNNIVGIKELKFGTKNIIKAVETKFSITGTEVLEMVYSFGLTDSSVQNQMREAIKPFINSLIKEIKECYKETQLNFAKIIIYGGGACIPGIAEYLELSSKLKVEVASPWTNTGIYPLKPMSRKLAPQFSVAVGLALNGLG